MNTLSMGMSDDAVVAAQEGATMVRLGRALFGARPKRRLTITLDRHTRRYSGRETHGAQ